MVNLVREHRTGKLELFARPASPARRRAWPPPRSVSAAGPVAAGSVAVVVAGGAVQPWATAAPQRVVYGQQQRRPGRDQGGTNEVQQDKAELVRRPAGGGEEPVG